MAQTTTPIVSYGAEESFVAASVEETLVVHPTLEVATTQDAIRISTSEATVLTSKMRQHLTQFAPVLLEMTSASSLISESTSITIVKTES